jgi:hypothetical protein
MQVITLRFQVPARAHEFLHVIMSQETPTDGRVSPPNRPVPGRPVKRAKPNLDAHAEAVVDHTLVPAAAAVMVRGSACADAEDSSKRRVHPATVFTQPELPITSESAGKYVAKVSHIRTRFRDQQPS